MNVKATFAKNLTKFKEEAGLTRYHLSKISGVPYNYLTAIEKGRIFPRIEVIEQLSDALGIPAWQFFEDEMSIEDASIEIIRDVVHKSLMSAAKKIVEK